MPGEDLSFAYYNPAQLSKSMDNSIDFNYINYFTDINYGYVSYAKHINELGSFSLGIYYMNYGEFIEANVNGEKTGTFTATEYAFPIIYSRNIDSSFQIGATLKPVYSKLENYTSFGLLADVGITYMIPEKKFAASLVVKNIGSQIKPYNEDNYEPVPFEVQIGITKKLLHAPFRFSIMAKNLETYDLSYKELNDAEPTNFNNTDKEIENHGDKFAENILRHFVFAMEFLPSKNFYVSLGLNYKRRRELQLTEKPGFTGFSYGFGFKISKLNFSYGRASYHLAGASNHFSISTNLSRFYKTM